VWESVRGQVVVSEAGYLAFGDTVLDKHSSFKIELVRRQYSGNAHAVIKGLSMLSNNRNILKIAQLSKFGRYIAPSFEFARCAIKYLTAFTIVEYRRYSRK